MRDKRVVFLAVGMLMSLLLGCSSTQGEISSNEREQIQNVVRQYVTQNQNIPQYTVRVEKTEKDWALVSVKPEGTESKLTYFYLRRSNGPGVPAAAPSVSPAAGAPAPRTVPPQFSQNPPPLVGITPLVETSSGWVIVLGPKNTFTDTELTAAGVPPDLKPPATSGE